MVSSNYKRVSYRRGRHRISVTVSRDAVSPVCEACLKKPGKRLNTHHWKEAYSFPEIRLNPLLALENSIQVDVPHHRVANSLREIAEFLLKAGRPGGITEKELNRLIDSMPEKMKTSLRASFKSDVLK